VTLGFGGLGFGVEGLVLRSALKCPLYSDVTVYRKYTGALTSENFWLRSPHSVGISQRDQTSPQAWRLRHGTFLSFFLP
jgi:hypothetical protein